MKGLLSQIEDDLVSGAPLADTLRKCVLLGGRAGSVALRDWATRELRGYPGDDDVPAYRVRGATLAIDALVGNNKVTGQRIDPGQLPEKVRDAISEELPFRHGIGELEAMVRGDQDTIKLTFSRAAALAQLIDQESGNPFQQVIALYWQVSRASIEGILDEVRTSLAELVAEMRAAMPREGDEPTASVADKALQVALGEGARLVTINAAPGAVVSGVTTGDDAPVKQRAHVTLRERVSAWPRTKKVAASVIAAVGLVASTIGIYEFLAGG